MSRPKKIEKIEVNTEIKNKSDNLAVENKEQKIIIKNLEEQNKESLSALEILQKQMQEMQSAFVKMQSNTVSTHPESKHVFELKCRLISGVSVYSPKREVERHIEYGKVLKLDEHEMEMVLKSNFVLGFLKNDVIYFVDEKDYEKCKIYKGERSDLSDNKIINMTTKLDSSMLVIELNKLTREKKEDAVTHSLFYKIVELENSGVLHGMPHANRKTIESYFKYKIDDARMLLANVAKIK